MGRKPKELTDDQVVQIEALAACLSQDQISDYLGITRPTFAAMIDRNPEIALRYKMGKAKAIASVAEGLLMKARGGDTASSIFYLKTQAGWRETNTVEVVGNEDSPLVHKVIYQVVDPSDNNTKGS